MHILQETLTETTETVKTVIFNSFFTEINRHRTVSLEILSMLSDTYYDMSLSVAKTHGLQICLEMESFPAFQIVHALVEALKGEP